MTKFVSEFVAKHNQRFTKRLELDSTQPPRLPPAPKHEHPLIASADVIIGKASGQVATLSEAVERVKPGGVIYVSPGVHHGGAPIETKKEFSLVGAGAAESVLNFQVKSPDTCLMIEGDGRWLVEDVALLAERALKKPAAAADVIDIARGELEVRRAVLAGAPFVVRDDGAVMGGSGCRVNGGARATIADSLIAFNYAQICAHGGARVVVTGCTLFGGTAGVLIWEDAEVEVEGGEIRRNDHAFHTARAGGRIVARGVKVVDAIRTGAYVEHGRIELESCSIDDCGGHGVGIDPEGEARIVACKIRENWECGVAVEGRAEILDCEISDNVEHGIWIGDETAGRVADNRITENGLSGIIIDPDSKLELGENELEGNDDDEVCRLGTLAEQVQEGFPPGVTVPEGVKKLARYQEEWGRLFGEVMYVAPGPLAGWPGREQEFAVFGTGPDGSSVAFWLRDGLSIERAPIVYLDSEGAENHVLARTFEEFLAILATGRDELHHGDEIEPEIDEDDEYKYERFVEWAKESFSVEPAQSVDAIREAAEKAHPGLDAALRA